jgi:hypothetical protein
MKLFVFSFIYFTAINVFGNITPYFLDVSVSAVKTKFTISEQIQINVILTNKSENRHPVLVPGNQSAGKKIIFFTWYIVDENNFHQEVYRDDRNIVVDNSNYGSVEFNYLDPGESTIVPFFFNDKKNYFNHVNSSYSIPDLPPGKYKIIAWYDPWSEELSQYAFNKKKEKNTSDSIIRNPELLDIPENGLLSTYFDLEIIEMEDSHPLEQLISCSKNCNLCKSINREQWKKTKRILRRNSKSVSEQNLGNHDSQFHHKNIAFLGDTPDAILASLPSYLSREIIFQNSSGIYYFIMTWQLGKVNRIISRVNTFFYMIGLRKIRLKDNKLNYSKLISLQSY